MVIYLVDSAIQRFNNYTTTGARAPFLEGPSNFPGPKANFEIKTC